MAMLCVRNTHIENIHAGLTPVTHTGDWSDVTVVDADGRRIPWTAEAATARPCLRPEQPGLDPVPEVVGDDRRMQSGVDAVLVADAAEVDRVGEDVMDLAAGQGVAPGAAPRSEGPTLRLESEVARRRLDAAQAAMAIVEGENLGNAGRLGGIDHELAPGRIGMVGSVAQIG